MFGLFALAAARSLVFKSRSEKDLRSVENFYKLYDGDVKVSVESTLPKGSYSLEAGDIIIDIKDKTELRRCLGVTERLEDVPAEMRDIVNELKKKEVDPISDLKSGAFSFAIFFTNDQTHIKNLKGIEETSGMQYFVSSDEKLAADLEVNFPGVFAYNAPEKTVLSLPFHSNFASLHAAMTIESFTKITSANIRQVQQLDQQIMYIIDKKDNYKALKNMIGNQIKAFSSEAKFIFFTPEEVPSLMGLLNTNESEYPLLLLMGKEGKHIVRGLTAANLESSIIKMLDGTAEHIILASNIPENNESAAVKVINTHTIDKVVADDKVDRLIVISSPNCGFCRTLKPIVRAFAEAMKEKSVDIYIGDYNVIENEEFKHSPITGVPTLFYIKKGTNSLMRIPAEVRTIPSLADFVASNGVSATINAADYKDLKVPAEAVPVVPSDLASEEESSDMDIINDNDLTPIPADEIIADTNKRVTEQEVL